LGPAADALFDLWLRRTPFIFLFATEQ